MPRLAGTVTGLALLAWAHVASSEPAPHLPEPGARGTAVTVIEGSRTEEIPLRYIGTYRDFAGPGHHLHLVELEGPLAEHVGVAAGMSGSPVYLDGRLLGALSYRLGGLPKQAVGGVTPIEDMLGATRIGAPLTGPADARFAPIATPVVVGGMTAASRNWLAERLEPMGLITVAGGESAAGAAAAPLKPGSAVGVQLLRGDMRIGATGTVTWVEGDRVLAFGHPFLGSGAVEIPMVAAEVIHTLADLAGSVKLSNLGAELGAIVEDRWSGIAGDTGVRARMVPVQLSVDGADYVARTFRFEVMRSAELSPLLSAVAVANALQLNAGYTRESTLSAQGTVRVRGLPDVPLEATFAGGNGSDPTFSLAADLLQTLARIWRNPFESVEIEAIELAVEARSSVHRYELEAVQFDRGSLAPGRPLRLHCTLRAFRGEVLTRELVVELPRRLDPQDGWVVAVGSPAGIERVLGNPTAHRLATAPDATSLFRALAEPRAAHRLTAVVFRPDAAVVARGESWAELPPSARRLLQTQTEVAPGHARRLRAPAAREEIELDGPVSGTLQRRLRLERSLSEEPRP